MKIFRSYMCFIKLLTFSKHFPFYIWKKYHKMTFSHCYFDSCIFVILIAARKKFLIKRTFILFYQIFFCFVYWEGISTFLRENNFLYFLWKYIWNWKRGETCNFHYEWVNIFDTGSISFNSSCLLPVNIFWLKCLIFLNIIKIRA